MTKFKVGDKVKCLSSVPEQFTSGKIYTVSRVNYDWDYPSISVECDDSGSDNGWGVEHFELAIDEETISTTFAPFENKFSTEKFKTIIDQTVEQINELSEKKGGEYANDDDRLANFRRNAANLGLTKEDVWSVYAGKHWDSIMTYVKDNRTGKKRERLESISGRCDDLIVYLLLMKAMISENGD